MASVRDTLETVVDSRGGKVALSEVQIWLKHIAQYEREFKKWEGRVHKIIKRYRDDGRQGRSGYSEAKFNILWSNVQTLVPATFSRLPQPDVSRRFRDNDPVGRVGSLILERCLDFEIQHYSDYRSALKACVYDRFLGGRGTAWVRYEPHVRAAEGQATDGYQVTEDVDEPQEELDYECVPVDYVHWKDFGHVVARTWEEVPAVWRIVYMSKDMVEERFGEDIANKLPYDSSPTEKDKYGAENVDKQAKIYEIWDKQTKRALWLSKSMPEFLDELPDPLGLEEFWPCPRPLFATITNDSLVPVPDFVLYQDQANELDILSDRIDGLIKALKNMGCYDASIPELARLFSEGENNTLIPVKNWAAFAEKNGLQGAINLVDLKNIAFALMEAYKAMEQIKQQIYEITGISDIVRGQTEASETATAQQIKGQYASLRIRHTQEDVSRFATELLQLKAQVMCGKFSPETLVRISAADQLSPQDQQYLEPALSLLLGDRLQNPEANNPNPLRSFRIEVAADTLVQIDEKMEKESAVELVTAIAQYLNGVLPVAQAAPEMTPLLMEMLKFAVSRFKAGKGIEGIIDETVEKLKQSAQQRAMQPPPPDPKLEVEKIKAESVKQQVQGEMAVTPIKAQAEMVKAQASVIAASEQARQAQVRSALPPQM